MSNEEPIEASISITLACALVGVTALVQAVKDKKVYLNTLQYQALNNLYKELKKLYDN